MRVTRRRFVTLATTGSLGLAGCTGGDDGGEGQQSPTETTAPTGTGDDTVGRSIEMVNTAFDPIRVSVDPGTTVEWVNEDGFDHDITAIQFHDNAADWSFSKTLSGGESTTFTFEEMGVYEYYCSIHGEGTMCGAVLVGGATIESSLPCEGGGGDDGGFY